MALRGVGHCIDCGERLETGHRFCPRCGAERWPPEPVQPEAGAPRAADAVPAPAAAGALNVLPWLYAAGAVYWLITCARAAAYLFAPGGVRLYLTQSGVQFPGMNDPGFAAFALGGSLFLYLAAAILHSAAYFGLRRRTAWGWVVAVLLATLWSLLLVGIPVLWLLMRRSARRAYGVG